MTALEIVQLNELSDAVRALADQARADDFRALDRLVRDFENGSNVFDRPGEALFGALCSPTRSTPPASTKPSAFSGPANPAKSAM